MVTPLLVKDHKNNISLKQLQLPFQQHTKSFKNNSLVTRQHLSSIASFNLKQNEFLAKLLEICNKF